MYRLIGIINAYNIIRLPPKNTLNHFLLSPNGRAPPPGHFIFGNSHLIESLR